MLGADDAADPCIHQPSNAPTSVGAIRSPGHPDCRCGEIDRGSRGEGYDSVPDGPGRSRRPFDCRISQSTAIERKLPHPARGVTTPAVRVSAGGSWDRRRFSLRTIFSRGSVRLSVALAWLPRRHGYVIPSVSAETACPSSRRHIRGDRRSRVEGGASTSPSAPPRRRRCRPEPHRVPTGWTAGASSAAATRQWRGVTPAKDGTVLLDVTSRPTPAAATNTIPSDRDRRRGDRCPAGKITVNAGAPARQPDDDDPDLDRLVVHLILVQPPFNNDTSPGPDGVCHGEGDPSLDIDSEASVARPTPPPTVVKSRFDGRHRVTAKAPHGHGPPATTRSRSSATAATRRDRSRSGDRGHRVLLEDARHEPNDVLSANARPLADEYSRSPHQHRPPRRTRGQADRQHPPPPTDWKVRLRPGPMAPHDRPRRLNPSRSR
jgi:hypothetical protein